MKLQDLLQERGQLATQMRDMHKTAEKEDRGFSAEERESWDKMSDKIDELDGRIKAEERASSLSGYTAEDIEAMKPEAVREKEASEITQGDAFSALLRSTEVGMNGLSAEQKQALTRAQAKGTDSAGGYLAPDEFANEIIVAMQAYGGIRGAANVMSTATGNTLDIPTNDDTSNTGSILAENTQDSEQDLTFGNVQMGAYKYTSNIIRVPVELLQDSAFDLDAYISSAFAERLGRATAAHYATGTGSSQPQGLSAATSGVTAAATGAVTYNELLDLKHAVDPAYRGNGSFVMNDATFLAVKKLVDGNSRPLWQPDIAQGTPGLLDGSPFIIDQGMASMGANAKPIVFGDVSGYWIRDVSGITVRRLVERYADYHQVGFVAIMRTDGAIVNGSGLRAMTMAAS